MYRMGKEEIEEVKKVIKAKKLFFIGDPAYGHQQEVARFERELAEKVGVNHALLLSGGGTAALICGLVGLGIGPGDEVIVPAYTFMASATAVLAAGAIPVLADVDETCLIDPDDIERKIGPNVKAIIPVHMVGMPCDMDRIMAIANRRGIKVLEDSCQCDGGSYKGKRAGSIGHAGAFSFNDFKIMCCGEGGALVTNDRTIYERAVVYSDSGSAFRPYASSLSITPFLGQQFRPTELQGAVLRCQLQKVDGILADLRAMKSRIMNELEGAPGIRFIPSNDAEADCGVVVAFQFDTPEAASEFAKSEGVGGWRPLDSGKHVYWNWTPILNKQVGHTPDVNPYNHPKNANLRRDIPRDSCLKTIDIIGRTVFINLSLDWSETKVKRLIKACAKAGRKISKGVKAAPVAVA